MSGNSPAKKSFKATKSDKSIDQAEQKGGEFDNNKNPLIGEDEKEFKGRRLQIRATYSERSENLYDRDGPAGNDRLSTRTVPKDRRIYDFEHFDSKEIEYLI